MPDSLTVASAALPPSPSSSAQLAALDAAIEKYRKLGDSQHVRYFSAERKRLHRRFYQLGLISEPPAEPPHQRPSDPFNPKD